MTIAFLLFYHDGIDLYFFLSNENFGVSAIQECNFFLCFTFDILDSQIICRSEEVLVYHSLGGLSESATKYVPIVPFKRKRKFDTPLEYGTPLMNNHVREIVIVIMDNFTIKPV